MAAIHEVIDELVKKHGDVNKEIADKLTEQAGNEISPQRIGQYRKGPKVPGADFILLWEQVFGEKILDLVKQRETIVSSETENLTHMHKSDDNKGNGDGDPEVYRTIIEGKTEYSLIPRQVLDKTQLISIEQVTRTWDELAQKNRELEQRSVDIDKRDKQIDFLLGMIRDLTIKSQGSGSGA
jgi:transcriptional regulator with XRE-family HTH domain